MLRKLKELFASFDGDHPASEYDLQLASAALLVEVSTADHAFDPREELTVRRAIENTFNLDSIAIDELFNEARNASANAPSLYDFTRIVNEHCSEEEKYKLVRECWRVAFADGSLDKYEDHRIRTIADLIYLPHSLMIKAKHEIRAKQDGAGTA